MTKSPTEKNCKIIVTYYGNRPPKIKDPTEIMTILDEVMDNDISIDKGLPCDTIIVNNSTDNKEFVSFLKKYNNKKTKNGIIKVIKGNNIGVSFGGYNLAFQKS